MITMDKKAVDAMSCSPAIQAFFFSLWPRYWADTTAPPVAKAANSPISRKLILSTKETPDTAASPTLATMIPSAIPTVTANICSIISGIINFISSFLVNI